MHLAEDVCLSVPHRQFVWTIPKRIRVFFRFHRGLLNQLPALAWRSLLQVYQALLGPDAVPGGVLAIQTFGQLIHFHPHIHGLVTDGAFAPDGRFFPVPANLGHEPFLRLWEDAVFGLLLEEKKIEPHVVAQVRSWRHSGFNVDRSVRLDAGDRDGIERLAQYMARGPFSLARLVRITPSGQVVYLAEKGRQARFPEPASEDLLGGVSRNFQVFEPMDFLAELVQHIPNKAEHLIRYYGRYSSKSRGTQSRLKGMQTVGRTAHHDRALQDEHGFEEDPPRAAVIAQRRRWAMLIKRVYHADPLLCPLCGGTMRIIAFIEAHQGAVIKKILEHCGLWTDPPTRSPPRLSSTRQPDDGLTYEPDGDFLDHARRENQEQPELPW